MNAHEFINGSSLRISVQIPYYLFLIYTLQGSFQSFCYGNSITVFFLISTLSTFGIKIKSWPLIIAIIALMSLLLTLLIRNKAGYTALDAPSIIPMRHFHSFFYGSTVHCGPEQPRI